MHLMDEAREGAGYLIEMGVLTVRVPFQGKTRGIGAGLFAALLLLGAPRISSADVLYTIVDLGVLTPGGTSSASAINATGMTVGSGLLASTNMVAAEAGPGGQFVSMGTLPGGRTSQALAVNSAGVVVGSSEVKTGSNPTTFATHAFSATGPGNLNDLGVSGGFTNSFATGINDLGEVVGYVQSGASSRGFLAQSGGSLTLLSTLGGANSQANGINAVGTIVGSADTGTGTTHAFTTQGFGLMDLGSLQNGNGNSFGNAINNLGVVVGAGGITLTTTHAFISQPGGLKDLGVLHGTDSSVANAINDFNVVVGSSSSTSGGISHAFLYNGSLLDLNNLIGAKDQLNWTLNGATGVNDIGQIVGSGLFQGQTHGFLLSQAGPPAGVPEPSTLVLGALGMLGVLARRGWRVRRARTAARPGVSPAGASPAR